MAIWHINGGRRLEGACFVQGSKNAVLPILAASIVCPAETNLLNVPQLSDVAVSLRILRQLGCTAEQQENDVYIDSRSLSSNIIPQEMMECMRSSVLFMGALLARCGEVHLTSPGGCKLGARPIDLHISAMKTLGAEVEERGCEIICKSSGLKGARIELPFPSVGATENAMLAACAAEGETIISGAAREPEIVDLQEYLRKSGAYISGAGTGKITVSGFSPERHVGHRIIPDRIVASTFLCAAAAAGGDIELRGVDSRQFSRLQHFLNSSGCDIIPAKRSVRLISDGRLHSVGRVVTGPYPEFPTDAQPLLMAALLKASGRTDFVENVFDSRFGHARELARFGADISVDGRCASVWGVRSLSGATVSAADLRGGAAMLIAGLAAEGESRVIDSGHITRGYENFDNKLRSLGADIFMEM